MSAVDVNDEQQHALRHAYGLPTFFSVHDSINGADRVWVIEDELRRLKADPMLDAIAGVFGWVPVKGHLVVVTNM